MQRPSKQKGQKFGTNNGRTSVGTKIANFLKLVAFHINSVTDQATIPPNHSNGVTEMIGTFPELIFWLLRLSESVLK